ncbi:MAG: hypothetical protein IJR63_01010 [Synergistaceae bacterium]|nr:hypothetical protein [Synergistaceae bacterium]
MNKAGKLLCALSLVFLLTGAGFAADYVYVTTNMTWAEFYAGEVGASSADLLSAGLDAISSPTARVADRFTQLTSESNDIGGRDITGVKDVQVRMPQEVYDTLADKSRYTVSSTAFDEYKEMNADGSFGKMVTETQNVSDAVITVSAPGTWGNYVLDIQSVDVTLGSGDTRYYLGALIETSDGEIYGMRHNNNLWFNAKDMALSVKEFVEPHGLSRSYKYTSDMAGKTITSITYMLKDRPDVVLTGLNVYLKEQTSADVSASGNVKSGANIPVSLTFSNVPDDAGYSLSSVTYIPEGGNRRNRQTITAYTYSGGTLTLPECKAGTYTATFTSGVYADISATFTATDYYATANMTWAEFYAGETGQPSSELLAAGLDAVSTPTVGHLSRFPLLWGATSPDYDGTVISGEKSVQVRMTGDVYNSLADKSRYTFSDEAFTEYKTVSADGSFGAMLTETVKASGAKVSLATGDSARWGHYVISVSGVSIDIGTSGDKIARNYRGVLLETSDGKIYGMRHDNNIWSNTDIAFTVSENYTEPHGQGVKRFHKYTSDMAGKTITKITYMLEGLPDVVIESLDLYVKPITSASVKPETVYPAGSNVPVKFVFSDVPDDAGYTLSSVSQGSGRNSKAITDYTYADGVLTIAGNLEPGTYSATFTSGKYADISAAVNVMKFATTNMTWAEFYAGEVGIASADLLTAGLDAISSPTARVANRFTQLTSESNDIGGRDITGVKAVQVAFTTQAAYQALSNDSRFTFTDEVFTQYKAVNSDGTFGTMVSETKTIASADVTLSSGASSTWGSYMLNITGLEELVISSGDENYYLGAVLETSDGAKYGLRHNNNLWFSAGTVAATVNDKYAEPHGVTRGYKYTAALEGKTVTRITFLLKNQPSAVVNCSVLLKKMTDSTVAVSSDVKAGVNVPVSFTFGNLPEGATYTLKALYSGTGRGHTPITDYTYTDGTLVVDGTLPAGRYQAIFGTDDYADIGVVFEVEDTYHYATTDMTWAEFYAGELGEASADLYTAGLDAISSPTARVATRFTQLTSESNDIGGRSITGVAAVHVRMNETVYQAMSNDSRFTFTDEAFTEYKDADAGGSFGAMVTETHVQEGAKVSLTSPGTWGDYQLSVSSIDVTVSSGDEYYYLGAIIETSDGKLYAMRHNNNLWFSAKDIALSTAEFVEPHGVSRNYAYTSDMEGKTVTRITYMLKDLPDEIVSCDVFLKLKTSASVAPKYEDGYHAFMAWTNLEVPLTFTNIPASADYKLSGVTSGTGRSRKAVPGCTMSGDVLTISGDVGEGTYTATFTDDTYANISATIRVYTTSANSKIISADKNAAGLSFLLTPAGVSDATDAVLSAQNFANATDYTVIDSNDTAPYTAGDNQIAGSGFTLNVALKDVPSGKRGILGFSHMFTITPASIGQNDFAAMMSKVTALPDVAYGWRVPTGEQLRDMGLIIVGVYPDGVSRDITGYVSSGLLPSDGAIMMSFGTVLVDREFTPSEEGKVYALSDEGEGTMSDGAFDGRLTATWYVRTPGGSSGGDAYSEDVRPTPTPVSPDTRPTPAPTSPDNTPIPAPVSPDRTPAVNTDTVTPTAPAVALTDTKKADITSALGKLSAKVTGTTEVAQLPAAALIGTQSATSTDSAVYLPVIEVSESKVYVFGVSLDKFAVNEPIYWRSNAVDKVTGDFLSASDEEEAVIFMDDSGEEVSTVPANKHVNVAAYLETGRTYFPEVTTTAEQAENPGLVGSSGSGCNAGMSAIILGLAFVLMRKK